MLLVTASSGFILALAAAFLMSDWLAATKNPLAVVAVSTRPALGLIASGGILMLAAGMAAAWLLARRIERPMKMLDAVVAQADARRAAAETRYETYWRHTAESLFVVRVTDDDRFVFEGLNPIHERLTGLSTTAIAGKEPAACLPPDVAATVTARYRRCVDTGKATRYEETLALPGGTRHWETNLAPVRDTMSGRITLLLGSARDITERKRAELAERETQELLQSTMDALFAHIAILDAQGTIIAVNAPWRRFADANGYVGANYGVGTNYLRVCETARLDCREMDTVIAGLGAVMRGDRAEFRFDYPCHCATEQRWFQLRITRFGVGDRLRLVVAHEDVTEVKRAEENVQRFTGTLLKLQDAERRRIARDLHDSTSQNLLGAALGIERALRLAPRMPVRAKAAIEESRTLLELSQREIRTVSYLLHPPMLDEAGLHTALRWYIEGFTKRSGITVDLQICPALAERRLHIEIETALFRVVQEALTNVHRHSGSAAARIRLVRVEDEGHGQIVLKIEDDGNGASQPASGASGVHSQDDATAGMGVGLPGMRERLRQLGGHLEIIWSTGSGTTVCATVPVRQDTEPASLHDNVSGIHVKA